MDLRKLDKAGMESSDGYRLILLAILLIIIGGMLSGCMQTIHGLASDIRSGATYVEHHTVDDK